MCPARRSHEVRGRREGLGHVATQVLRGMERWIGGTLHTLLIFLGFYKRSFTQDILTSTLEAYGNPIGYSAMALTVGLPCGIAVQLVLDGAKGFTTPGIHAPYTKEICDPIREILESEGLGLVEKVL